MRRCVWVTWLLVCSLLLLSLLEIFLGSVSFSFSEIWNLLLYGEGTPLARTIVLGFRVPRMITALLAGIALSVSGLQMQTYFANPLAGPYVLGISGGASFGAALSLLGGGLVWFSSTFSLAFSAWLGAALSQLVITLVAIRERSTYTILILGVMLGSCASAGVSIMQYATDAHAVKQFVVWGMGSVANVSGESLLLLFITVVVGVGITVLCIRPLDLLLLGQRHASLLGLSIRQIRLLIFFSNILLAGTVTAFCGPIGFVGVAVPHVVRALYRTERHGYLLLGSILLGGTVLMLADLLSQLPGASRTLPLNAVASLMGLPVIIYILLQGRRFRSE